MEKIRCSWCEGNELYEQYHDMEWGIPIYKDLQLFEFLILESFQAGLSWITILKKRENFRLAFDFFDYKKIAAYDKAKEEALMQNAGIIRNKLKIKASISNAQAFIAIQEEFGSFSTYIWNFSNGKPISNAFNTAKEVPASTALSDAISADLKKRGFKFVGSTIIYAYMQATGMVNDHITSCFRYREIQLSKGIASHTSP